MLDVETFIRAARDYYAAAGKPSMVLPLQARDSNPNSVRLGSLDACDLQHGLSKADTSPTNPETVNQHLFDVGEAVAELFQKALLYYAQSSLDYGVQVEGKAELADIRGLGRYDALVSYREMDAFGNLETKQIILEFKNTEGVEKRSVGEPRYSYALQCIAYSMALGIPDSSIVTASKWAWQVWYVRPVSYNDLEKGFMLTDKFGNSFVPKWGENWNTPEKLSFKTVRERITHMQSVMKAVRDLTSFDPRHFRIENPLSHPKGWLCQREADKGKKRADNRGAARPQTRRPACEFFSLCFPEAEFRPDGTIEVITIDEIDYLKGAEPVAV